MTKWTNPGARGVAIAGVIAILGVIVAAVTFIEIRGHRTVTEYAVDAPAAPFGGGWECRGCGTLDGFDLTDRAAGTAAELPTDRAFRGVVVTSEALPEDLRNVRVMSDGYYLEFADGTVRFVADTAPWAALVPELEPEWIGYLVGAGVIDSP
jgi:hypothetical protein